MFLVEKFPQIQQITSRSFVWRTAGGSRVQLKLGVTAHVLVTYVTFMHSFGHVFSVKKLGSHCSAQHVTRM